MSRSGLVLELDDAPGVPVFLRIAHALVRDIRRGRLRAGDALPGSRPLATALGVHRNTVIAAYRELLAEGWIVSSPARGSFVSPAIPDVTGRPFDRRAASRTSGRRSGAPEGIASRPGFDVGRGSALLDALGQRAIEAKANAERELSNAALSAAKGAKAISSLAMSLGGGIPDVRLVPAAELARAVRTVLRRRASVALAYGDAAGPRELRAAIAAMVAETRGVAATAGDVLVTRGSQMAVDLVARTLLGPGDVVAVEALGYRPAWEALRAAGARLVALPVDAYGLDVDALEALCLRERVRGVYVTPHHQFPTTVTLGAARRLRLLEIARDHRMFVLEDDYDHEFHYEGRPVLPLASADLHGVVVYVGTLSKVLAPGLRIGFVIAPPPVLERLVAVRMNVDRQGDQILELAVADLLDDGSVPRHVRRARRIYAQRRLVLIELLERQLGGVLSFRTPAGGTAIWARVAKDVSVDVWAERALERGLALQSGRRFAFDGKSRPYLRIGFAQHDEHEAREAVRRLVTALPRRA